MLTKIQTRERDRLVREGKIREHKAKGWQWMCPYRKWHKAAIPRHLKAPTREYAHGKQSVRVHQNTVEEWAYREFRDSNVNGCTRCKGKFRSFDEDEFQNWKGLTGGKQ